MQLQRREQWLPEGMEPGQGQVGKWNKLDDGWKVHFTCDHSIDYKKVKSVIHIKLI